MNDKSADALDIGLLAAVSQLNGGAAGAMVAAAAAADLRRLQDRVRSGQSPSHCLQSLDQ